MNNDNVTRSYRTYNKKNFFIELKMFNPDGDVLILNPAGIFHLVIEDDMHFWPIRGFFIYDNVYEIIERKLAADTAIEVGNLDATSRADLKAKKPYMFRNDGRDFLNITIKPESEVHLPDEQWEMSYNCVIYDKEDIECINIGKKQKKFYFWDVDYQTMLEKKIQWSSATSEYNDSVRRLGGSYKPSQASDEARKMYTGDIIKAILNENNFKVTTDVKKFDKGSTKLFYTCFNNKNVWENIQYILNNNLSEKIKSVEALDEYDVCIFNKDRYSKTFELIPLYKLFAKAGNTENEPGELQLEHTYFEEIGDVAISSLKAPTLPIMSTTKDIKLGAIKTYQYVDMSSVDNTTTLVTTPVHSYDFKNKTFSINVKDSNIEEIFNKMKKLYIDSKVLVSKGGEPLLTLNNNKLQNLNINPIYSIRSDKAAILRSGVGNLLYSSLFLNGCLYFQMEGATVRQSGTFIGIDRKTFTDNNFDYKLCGQWFVTCVKHVFTSDSYTNEITAVKNYSFTKLKLKTTEVK
ncbi:MAG: hypothetical protein WCG06_01190 [Candidatus Omnitrophota bacterium]